MVAKGHAVVSGALDGTNTVVHKMLDDGTVKLGVEKKANAMVSGSLTVTGSTLLSASSGLALTVSGSSSFDTVIDGQVNDVSNHLLSGLSNVSASTDSPTDGILLVYDTTTAKWYDDSAVFVGSNEPSTYTGRLWYDSATTGSMQTVDPIRTITGSYSASVSDVFIMCDATLGDIQVTTYVTAGNVGRALYVKKVDSSANTVTVSGNGSNIDGTSTKIITTQYDTLTMVSTATSWNII
jgi:hypothetical protein